MAENIAANLLNLVFPSQQPKLLNEPTSVIWEVQYTYKEKSAYCYGRAGGMEALGHYQGRTATAWVAGVIERDFVSGNI